MIIQNLNVAVLFGKMNSVKRCVFVFPLVLLVGCATTATIQSGVLATPGFTIEAEDGTFKIVSGQQFTPRHESEIVSDSEIGTSDYKLYWGQVERVRITVPDHEQPFYGLLLLLKSYNGCTTPADRSYEIHIPEKYVNAATGGRVSVVFEKSRCSGYATWVLWLSDQPIR